MRTAPLSSCSRLALFPALLVLPLLVADIMAHAMPGGARPLDGAANDASVIEAAKFAVEHHNQKQNSDLKLLKVVSASRQVVAGSLTRVKLWAASLGAGTVQEFDAAIWEKPWEKFKEATEFKAVEGTSRQLENSELALVKEGKLLPEGSTASSASGSCEAEPVPVTDPAVQEAAEKALAALQRRSNSLFPYQLKSVKSSNLKRDASNDGDALFFLTLELTRGLDGAVETHDVKIQVSGKGEWTLK